MTPERDERPLWHEAASFAARAHANQLRKDGATPYAAHTTRVAMTVACVFGVTDEVTIAAALLHDVIEDTGIDYDDLLEQFGAEVATIVAALSKDPRLIEPKREAAYDAQLAAACWRTRLIKLADVHDNLSDAVTPDARRKLAAKARRAVALAEADAELADARQTVEQLIARVEEA